MWRIERAEDYRWRVKAERNAKKKREIGGENTKVRAE